ncbi:multifunctional methyltransferase subunit TRM112-like protein isoform X1 [Nematostella vectensis]|uniref:multifunctional methyltransferase subunit TRM112-like protein isoform X1 n=1 Tax=Nematostella vectensis TaxID=45351 RepID=UPI0013903E3A|nr:multifunctional methyltransferase subunit TRM112-like protein isoform X1 [Nematostella vectensis]
MRLLTHNMLKSHVKGVKNGFPLAIEAQDVQVCEVDFNPEFISRMIPKLEWEALVQAAQQIGHGQDLPTQLAEGYESDNDFLKKAHHVLLEPASQLSGNFGVPVARKREKESRQQDPMFLRVLCSLTNGAR